MSSAYHAVIGEQAITKAEWEEAQAKRDRPVTDDPIQLHGERFTMPESSSVVDAYLAMLERGER